MTNFERAGLVAGDQAFKNVKKERFVEKKNTDIVALGQPESVDDPLIGVARDGVRRM